MESGSQPSLADSTTYQAPRVLQEELEEISPTSLGQVSEKFNDDDDDETVGEVPVLLYISLFG